MSDKKLYNKHCLKKDTASVASRRGKLRPLLTDEQKASCSIQELSYDFSCRITRLYQFLTEDSHYKEFIYSKQIIRSGSSVGANVVEAQHAQSDADFLSKMQIALKEANETEYWINLLHDNGYLNDVQFSSIYNDCIRILKLLNSIVRTTRNKIGK